MANFKGERKDSLNEVDRQRSERNLFSLETCLCYSVAYITEALKFTGTQWSSAQYLQHNANVKENITREIHFTPSPLTSQHRML